MREAYLMPAIWCPAGCGCVPVYEQLAHPRDQRIPALIATGKSPMFIA